MYDDSNSLLSPLRTLILLRHAKSALADAGMDDHSRPLNERGRNAAPLIAGWLADRGLIPDVILTSSAVRTQQTLELLLNVWNEISPNIPAQIECPELYLASPNAILASLENRCQLTSKSDQLPNKVLLLGHNPGLELLASMLAGQSITLATAACAVFDIATANQPQWKLDLKAGGISKKWLVTPKTLA